MHNPQARLAALKHLFSVNPAEWCQIRTPEHAAHVILASLAIDLGAGPAIEAAAAATQAALLHRYLPAIPDRPDLAQLKQDVQTLIASESHTPPQVRIMIGRLIRALAESESPTIAALHREALAAENLANRLLKQEYEAQTRFPDAEAQKPTTIAADAVDPADIATVLSQAGFGNAVRVTRMTPVSGGFSKQTTLCEIGANLYVPSRLIVRADVGVAFGGASVIDEYKTAMVLHRAGVRVPKPLALGPGSDAVRPRFMVMEWAPGSPFGWTPALRSKSLCQQLATELAKTHRIPAKDFAHVRGSDIGSAERMLADIARREDAWRTSTACDPIIEYALHWLKKNVALSQGMRCLVHGDYRPHNVLQRDERITAILDWEHAKIAHPAEDLAYVREAAEALWSWEEFLDAYVEAGGHRPPADVLNYHEAFAALFNLGILGQIEAAFTGAAHEPLAHISSVIHNRPASITRLAGCLGLG